ncbi:hypothetical protein Sa4125_09210 [Aureimonas sp. SA4125]|uniref:glycosyltransferase n=1 Tax=Aureimonas sp. SA4125 TaxID=2826993 RepID=UPI001CC715BE|nr:glycosyltransferase [Aureimonas sp. SA4125]BDA83379.1 hypothetical protein Sa4125_09210 [Aureimonas sp. SA4125]
MLTQDDGALVHIRTPTYKRPAALRRALEGLRDQTWQNWVCDVYDDDPDAAGELVCSEIGDPRIRHHRNAPRRYASKNIDQCFSRENPHGASYFFVLEDDNLVLPTFIEQNIELMRTYGVALLLRNQVVEHLSGSPDAYLGESGVLDDLFREGLYDAATFRSSLLSGIGVSNGGLFWSSAAKTELEIGYPCNATLQEYMRTFSIAEDIYVAMEPLGVWAENGEQTTRDSGGTASYLKRELDLKRAVQCLQRNVWKGMSRAQQKAFLTNERLASSAEVRARVLSKALIPVGAQRLLGLRETLRLAGRGAAIRLLGRNTPTFSEFVVSRSRQH